MKSLSILCLLTLSFLSAPAQPVDSLWSRLYGGTGNDRCNAVRQTTDGGYILTGQTNFSPTDVDAWLVKTNSQGDLVWSQMNGGSQYESAHDVVLRNDGGYAVAGTTTSSGNGTWDTYFARFGANGNFQNSVYWGEAGVDISYSMVQAPDGGFVIGGETVINGDNYEMLLVRTDSAGGYLWSQHYGGNQFEGCRAIRPAADGGYLLAGYTGSYGAGASDFWLVKTNPFGAIEWTRTYGGAGWEYCLAISRTHDGGNLLAGYTYPTGGSPSNFYVVKTDPNGTFEWSRTYGGSGDDRCFAIAQTPDGGYALGGFTMSYGSGNADFWLLKISAAGDSLWSRTFGGPAHDYCTSLEWTGDGGFVLAGYTSSFGVAGEDIWLVKTGPENLSSASAPQIVPLAYGLEPNYPNPFNGATTIRFVVPQAGRVTVRSHDVLGRQVELITDGFYSAGRHTLAWDCPDCPSGTYLITLSADGFRATQRAMLVR